MRAALRRRVRAPRALRGTTVGALVLCGLLTMLAVAEAHYWLFGHRFQCNVYTCHNGTASWQEQVARAAGQLANCAFGLLLLPCARNSVWTVAFGVPWEATIEIHRRLGSCMLGCGQGGRWRDSFATQRSLQCACSCRCVAVHVSSWWWAFHRYGLWPSEALPFPSKVRPKQAALSAR